MGETGVGDQGPFHQPGTGPTQTLLVISVIGPGSVTLGGEPVRFATRHAELAIYLLALAGADGMGRDELIGALWPGVESRAARPRLRTALWQIRRALCDHAWRIERERGLVVLALDGVNLDLRAGHPISRDGLLVGWNFSLPAVLAERVA